MALAIESNFLAEYNMSLVDGYLYPRYLVYRACALATVISDSSLRKRLQCARAVDLATSEALEWQADQDDDLDEAEVIHHLHQQVKSSPVFEHAFSRTERSDTITTLVTSCSVPSPSLLAMAEGRPLSSFRRVSFRQSMFAHPMGNCSANASNFNKIIPNALDKGFFMTPLAPQINGESLEEICGECVVWHMQFDIVDLRSPRTLPTWRPGKRRRTTVNQFHQVPAPPEQDASPINHPPETKRFKGVRYRPDRRTWAAEVKPPKSKDKVSFGEFKSQAQAARAIDAAFHYYGKPHLLNFPDSPGILSNRPSPGGVLNENDKRRFVKERVKWLASVASTLPSSPPLLPLEIPESSSRGCIGETLGFRTLSGIASFLSCGVADESDDGISQPRPSPPPDALSELAGSASMEAPFLGAVAAGGIMGSLEEYQGMLDWSSEDALVSPRSFGRWSPSSSVQTTHVVDESSAPAVMNMTNSAEPSCESQGSWMNDLALSSLVPLSPRSPTSFHVDVTHGLMESESFGRVEWLRG